MKKGAFTLLVTPFKRDYSLDEDTLRQLVRRQVDSDIDGIAPLGVTGENSLMNNFETNTMGAKKALELMGLINGVLRPPMTKLSESNTAVMTSILREKGLI